MDIVDILLVVVGIGYLLVRRLAGEAVQLKRLLLVPVVLTVVGVSQLRDLHDPGLATVGFLVLGAAISLAIGAVRGLTVYLGTRGGELWMRYRLSTVGLWVANIAAKVVLVPVEVAVTGQPVSAATHGLLFTLGLGTLAESLVVLARAAYRDGTVVWSKGRGGRPTRPAPAFDRVRDQVRSGSGLRGVVSLDKRDW